MQLKSGTLLQGGKYRIEKVLGQGGFGITYLAVQTNLKNRKVAIKEFFLKEHCERDSSTSHVSMGTSGSKDLVLKFRNKFIKEAETISELRNHHIITIYDVFEENGTAYYVMEYLSGGSLSERIPSGGLPESEALDYIRQVADALSYIHSEQILHLDVKPSNILFRKNNEAVLIDFGISKHYDEAGGSQTSSTPVGVSKGYAPLEQYKMGGVSQFSPATDVYSLGATLYKLLTGQTPPDADDIYEDGLTGLPQSISAQTRAAVEKAMSPRRKDRPQSVVEFMSLLEQPEVPDEGDETVVIGADKEDVVEPGDVQVDPVRDDDKGNFKKWLWPLAAGLAVVVVAIFMVFRPEPDSLQSDLLRYHAFVDSGDSLSRLHRYAAAKTSYDSAAVYEFRYASTRYSDRFRLSAGVKSSEVQSKIDSAKVADSLAAVAAANAAAARAEADRLAAERRRIEEMERLKKSTSYRDGILRVKGVEYPMVYVSGGSFDMGATSEQGSDADSDEQTVHRVTLSSYRIGKYEVTQDLWEAVMGSNPSHFKGARRPVENVYWDECQAFINKLNELTGQNFRLPTEAEWEFAARGGNSSRGYKYSGSNNVDNVAWYSGNSVNTTHNVGTKSPNELGVYDMSGNVWEWCSDWYGEYSSASQTNPKGPGNGSGGVNRGGGWDSNARYSRVSNRNISTPDVRGNNLGFRLCL